MIMATVGPGEKIIIPRNIHRSVMGGLILSGAIPLFVRPEVDEDLQIAMNVTAEAYETSIWPILMPRQYCCSTQPTMV